VCVCMTAGAHRGQRELGGKSTTRRRGHRRDGTLNLIKTESPHTTTTGRGAKPHRRAAKQSAAREKRVRQRVNALHAAPKPRSRSQNAFSGRASVFSSPVKTCARRADGTSRDRNDFLTVPSSFTGVKRPTPVVRSSFSRHEDLFTRLRSELMADCSDPDDP